MAARDPGRSRLRRRGRGRRHPTEPDAGLQHAAHLGRTAQPVMPQLLENGGFNIGDVTIAGRVLTAPMTGVSDLPFRRAASRLGAAYVATEMVACELFASGRPDVVRRAAVGDGLPLTVIQLVGRQAGWMGGGG